MLGPFDLFDLALEGFLGRCPARIAFVALVAVLLGAGWHFGLAEWLWDQFIAFKTQQHTDLINELLGAAGVPTTTTTSP